MKSKRAIILICYTFIAFCNIHSQQVINYTPEIPQGIKAISNVDSLQRFILSNNFDTSIAACLRMGEIGSQKDIPFLIDIFSRHPYSLGFDIGPDIKYYALLAIGRIGGPSAEEFLKRTATDISIKIDAHKPSFTNSDSLITAGAALEALSEIGSVSARAFLDSTFNNGEYASSIRLKANMAILEIDLKKPTIRTAGDTAKFLIEKWKEVPWAEHEYKGPGIVEPNFLVRRNIESLLFRYRSYTFPYVERLLSELKSDDPKKGALQQLKINMERNPNQQQK